MVRLDYPKRAADRAAATLRLQLGRGCWSLRAIARTAPLVGMLGSLFLFIEAFRVYDPVSAATCDCAGGPAEAFVPFALGLPVSLLATAGWRYINHQVEAIELEMRVATIELVGALHRPPRPAYPASSA